MALVDEMLSPRRLDRFRRAANRQVVALGAAGGEDDLGGVGADQRADGAAGLVQGCFGLLTEMMDAGCIAPHVAHRLGHPVGDQRIQRSCRVMVQIDAHGVKN